MCTDNYLNSFVCAAHSTDFGPEGIFFVLLCTYDKTNSFCWSPIAHSFENLKRCPYLNKIINVPRKIFNFGKCGRFYMHEFFFPIAFSINTLVIKQLD